MRQAEERILAQKPPRLAPATRLRRLMAILVLPFVGVVAAFGIAPDTITDTIVVNKVVEDVALPVVTTSENTEDAFWREERVQRGDTLAGLLARLGVEDPEALRTLRMTRDAKALYQLVPGRTVRA